MRVLSSRRGLVGVAGLVVVVASGIAGALLVSRQAAQNLPITIQKANVYIDVAKTTERAANSWDRYASWVNLKTGPTGKERYITYGMYRLHDVAGLMTEARSAARRSSGAPKLDAAMLRYLDAYEGLAPVMNRADAYYESQGYQSDNAAEGQSLHKLMVPLAHAFLAERKTMRRDLRKFVRDVEKLELAEIETREGRMRAWHVGRVMHAANNVLDLFPRDRPEPMDSETFDKKLSAIGPDTPGEKLDELMAGVVRPSHAVIDVPQIDLALRDYGVAVEAFDRFASEKPDGLQPFKDLPSQVLRKLRDFREPLARNQGREFDGAGRMVGEIVQLYFTMLSASSAANWSQLQYLP